MQFIEEVGYPLCTKPDNGVGASDTHKIENQQDLEYFFATMPKKILCRSFDYAMLKSSNSSV